MILTCSSSHLADTEGEKAIGLDLSIDENIVIGQDFYVRATVTNKTGNAKQFELYISGRATLYTGASGQSVKSNNWNVQLNPGQSELQPHNIQGCIMMAWIYVTLCDVPELVLGKVLCCCIS